MSIEFKEDLDKFLFWIKKQDLDFSMKPEEFGYNNPFLIIADAVLSINRQYNTFVKPRIELLKIKFNEINNLDEIYEFICSRGKEEFMNLWNYNHLQRVELLIEIIKFFIEYRKENNFGDDLKAMKHWAHSKKELPIRGIGFKTNQYLRMMLGVSTVKPDVHLHRAVKEAVSKKVSDKEVVSIIESAANKLNLEATSLDHAIWKTKAVSSKNKLVKTN